MDQYDEAFRILITRAAVGKVRISLGDFTCRCRTVQHDVALEHMK